MNEFKITRLGNILEFEHMLLRQVEQEKRIDKSGPWSKIADRYVRQLIIISSDPYPLDLQEVDGYYESSLSIKKVTSNTSYSNFYRWGISGGITGNHRIIYAIHNYNEVILLHHFLKNYNGQITRFDLKPTEKNYEGYCRKYPSLY